MVYIYMGMRIGNGHKLPPSPAGTMFGSPLQTTSIAQHRRQEGDYAILGLVMLPSRWNATIFVACKSLRDNHGLFRFFRFFDFSILDPPAGYPPTSTFSFDIQTSFVAQYGLFDAPDRVFTRHSYIIVATSLSPGFGPSEKGTLAESLES